MSFFVNAGVRFVEEMCKIRAFVELWDELTRERYGVDDAQMRRFRYGVQVNSLGLTEAQPENNVQRIVLEMLAVTLSKSARARAVQLPAWNEALGLPRPWDQQWSLRLQQVLAYESDLLEHEDLFEGSLVVQAKVDELVAGARDEIDRVQEMGGAVPAVESGYMKEQLVASHAARRSRIESGDEKVVGVNCWTETEPSPLTADPDAAVQVADPEAERQAVEAVRRWRDARDQPRAQAALERLRVDAKSDSNLMRATLAAARAGVTTGEWAGALREVFGEYRAPTGVSGSVGGGRTGRHRAAVRCPRAGPGHGCPARRPVAAAGRQTGTGRALQRCRADLSARPRRRVRGRLPGHPTHAGRDRGRGGGRGRPLRRAVHPVRFASRPRAARARRASRRRAPATYRWWSAGSSRPGTPCSHSLRASAAGMMPPTTTGTSPAPASRSPPQHLGHQLAGASRTGSTARRSARPPAPRPPRSAPASAGCPGRRPRSRRRGPARRSARRRWSARPGRACRPAAAAGAPSSAPVRADPLAHRGQVAVAGAGRRRRRAPDTPVGARYSPNTSRSAPAHSPVVTPARAQASVAGIRFVRRSAAVAAARRAPRSHRRVVALRRASAARLDGAPPRPPGRPSGSPVSRSAVSGLRLGLGEPVDADDDVLAGLDPAPAARRARRPAAALR